MVEEPPASTAGEKMIDVLTPAAGERGMGCGFNTLRVSKGVGYFAGYDDPPTCFGVVIVPSSCASRTAFRP